MALFNWFSNPAKPEAIRRSESAEAGQLAASQLESSIDKRKQQRHARRELLYVAIREALTRSGVLSSGYKFKVLSLDQVGDEFMVMVDLAQGFGAGFDKLSDMEAAVIKNARERFQIVVPTVYWRLNGAAVLAAPVPDPARDTARGLPGARNAVPGAGLRTGSPTRHAIEGDQMAAFNRALLAASSKARPGSMEETVTLGSKSLAYPPLADFADTEMSSGRESQAMPALGRTQYGDLN